MLRRNSNGLRDCMRKMLLDVIKNVLLKDSQDHMKKLNTAQLFELMASEG